MPAHRYILFIIFASIVFVGMSGCSTSKKLNDNKQQQQDSLLNNLLGKYPQLFKNIVKNKKELECSDHLHADRQG